MDALKKPGKRPPPAPGPGRPKGVPNKVTRLAKDCIALAAERLGGVDRMVEWVKEDPANERAFWATIYPKLIPVTVSGDPDAPLQARVQFEVVGVLPPAA